MSGQGIKIAELKFALSAGQAMQFEGKHSGKTLAGIDLEFTVRGQREIDKVEELLTHEAVQVDDPFANRSYKASLQKKVVSYQEGYPDWRYVLEIRELDLPPQFELLDISGHHFPVLKYEETDEPNDIIGMQVLLRLSPAELSEFRALCRTNPIEVRRVGVDQEPRKSRWGGGLYWSEHQQESQTYFKQVCRFYPPDYYPHGEEFPASGLVQSRMAKKLQDLSVRLEMLLDDLVQAGVISKERREDLLQHGFKSLADDERMGALMLEFHQAEDAETLL